MFIIEELPLINKLPASLFRYAIVGFLVAVVDIGSFMVLLNVSSYRPFAVAIAFSLGVGTHFSLNRWFSFKNFERKIQHQARTYFIVSGLMLVATIILIELIVGFLNISPFFAKLIAAAINLPLSFLGHKYLSFNKGIRARYRQLMESKIRS